MSSYQSKSNSYYNNVVKTSGNLSETVGRLASFEGKEDIIFQDILNKINILPNTRLLDIGCGFGNMALHLIEYANINNISLNLLDIDSVIQKIVSDSRFDKANIELIKGVFPDKVASEVFDSKYDYIIAYSVLHYSDNPADFIEKAFSLLKPGGALFIADLPNLNRVGRFLSTEFGRQFQAEYKGLDIHDIEVYKDHLEFFSLKKDDFNDLICDELIIDTIKKYRVQGHDAWVLAQSDVLPFSNSREDILIKKKFD